MSLRLVPAAALATSLFGCTMCQTPPPPAAGNLDRPGDVVVVTPPSDGAPHTFAFVSNPEIQQIRVLDLTALPEGDFVRAPNVFFPLSILTGPATSDLSAPVGLPARVLALDTALDEIYLIRTVDEEDGAAFTRVGDPVPTAPAPAAFDSVLRDGALLVFVALPEQSAVQVLTLDPATAEVLDEALVPLQSGGRPADVAVDPTGETVVVADAVKSQASLIHLSDADLAGSFASVEPFLVDTGGPTRRVVVGRVFLEDGLAPVALFLRRDENFVVATRLFRPGFREERAEVLGIAEVPGVPTAAYVPDQGLGETPPTVCCIGLPTEGGTSPEATRAWAAVAVADGVVFYLALQADPVGDGRGVVRLIDVEQDPPGPAVDPNTTTELWVVPEGADAAPRPSVVLQPVDNFGTPPVVPLLAAEETLTLTWEGVLPSLARLPADFSGGSLAISAPAPLEELTVQPGDLVELALEDAPAGCADTFFAAILDVEGSTAELSVEPAAQAPALDDDDVLCIEGAGGVRASLRAGEAFVVESVSEGFLGRLAFDERADPTVGEPAAGQDLELPGLRLSLVQSPAGEPVRDSVLVLPLTMNLGTVGLDLARETVGTQQGFSDLARLPIAMAGGEMRVPSGEEAEPIVVARRIVLVTPFRLFTFDEGETNVNDVASYR